MTSVRSAGVSPHHIYGRTDFAVRNYESRDTGRLKELVHTVTDAAANQGQKWSRFRGPADGDAHVTSDAQQARAQSMGRRSSIAT